MKLNTLTAAIIAASAAAITSASAFADDSAQFEAQLAVTSVNACNFTVTPENGTAMTATYKYTAADQAAGTFGTTTLDTTEPLTVLVSSGGDTCPLGQFTVATNNPGFKIAKNTAGIRAHDGGVWPLKWYYTQFDAYTDALGTVAATDPTQINGPSGTYLSTTGDPDAGAPAVGWRVVSSDAANELYGTYAGGTIPGLSSSPNGGHIRLSQNGAYLGATCTGSHTTCMGMYDTSYQNDYPTAASPLTVTPAAGAASVRIGLAQVLATFPYANTTKAPDPLTVFDTVSGGGVPLTGTGTMTITAL